MTPSPQQSQQQASPLAPALPYPVVSDKADILDKIRPEEIVEIIRNRLMGKVLDVRDREWKTVDALKDNAISEIGAWDISNLVLSVANQNVSISKLNDKEIRRRAFNIMKTAVKMIIVNWQQYKITNTAQISFISEIVFSIAFITMKQCESEGVRKMIIGTRQETHQIADFGMRNVKKSIFRRNN